jgi:O-glycosyl hydrolase
MGMTIQNEPMATKWESCIYTAEEEEIFLKII